MNLITGIAMLVIALVLIWVGRPYKAGAHLSFLRFGAALVVYPPVVLAFTAMGMAAVISRFGSKATSAGTLLSLQAKVIAHVACWHL